MTDALKAREALDRTMTLLHNIAATVDQRGEKTYAAELRADAETLRAALASSESPPAQTSDEGVRKALELAVTELRNAKDGLKVALAAGQTDVRELVANMTEATKADAIARAQMFAKIEVPSTMVRQALSRVEEALAALSRGEAGKPCRSCGSTKTPEQMRAEGFVTCCPERSANDLIDATHHPEAGAPSREAIREQLIAILDPIAHSLPDFRQGNINNGADQILSLFSPPLKASDLEREKVIAGLLALADQSYWHSNEELLRKAVALLSSRPGAPEDHEPRPVPQSTISEGWRPIEMAPKNGTVIDVWGPDHGRMTDCYWGKPEHTCGEAGQYCDSDWHGQRPGWVDGTFNEIVGRMRPGFTHWMPLPAPPAPTQDASPALSEGGES